MYDVEVVARLTDHQILYFRHLQSEKVKAASEGIPAAGAPASAAPRAPVPSSKQGPVDVLGGKPPHRETMIGFMTQVLRLSKGEAERQYEHRLAKWKEAKEAGRDPEW